MSPTNALFSAFLGYNPMGAILGAMDPKIVSAIPKEVATKLTSSYWFPQMLQNAFMPPLRVSFYLGAILSGIAAVLSAMRGQKYVHEDHSLASDTSSSGHPEEKKGHGSDAAGMEKA
jgi:hypothetical protein